MVQLDTRLPMMIQQPNVLAALDAGTQAAANQASVMRQAEGQNIFRQYGAGAMQGDQNALAKIASFDPMMGQTMDFNRQENARADARLGMDQERLTMLRDEVARGLAAEKNQAQAMKEAQMMDRLVQGAVRAHAAGDMTSFARLTEEAFGTALPPTPEGLAALAAANEGAKAYLSNLPKQDGFRNATPEEAAQYGAAGGQFGPDGRFYPINPPSGMAVEVGPDGTTRVVQGPGAQNTRPLTEGQAKDNVFATRATGALDVLDSVGADAMASRAGRLGDALSGATMGLSREVLQSEDYQVAKQAGDEFLQAILRKDTGAAITEGEQSLYGVTYLPQPGDGPRVLEAKRQSRIRAVEALKSGMSIQQLTTVERALVDAARKAEAGAAGQEQPQTSQQGQRRTDRAELPNYSGMTREQLLDNVPTTEEAAAEWNRRYDELEAAK